MVALRVKVVKIFFLPLICFGRYRPGTAGSRSLPLGAAVSAGDSRYRPGTAGSRCLLICFLLLGTGIHANLQSLLANAGILVMLTARLNAPMTRVCCFIIGYNIIP